MSPAPPATSLLLSAVLQLLGFLPNQGLSLKFRLGNNFFLFEHEIRAEMFSPPIRASG